MRPIGKKVAAFTVIGDRSPKKKVRWIPAFAGMTIFSLFYNAPDNPFALPKKGLCDLCVLCGYNSTYHTTDHLHPNRYTVVWRYVSPGLSTVEGKFG